MGLGVGLCECGGWMLGGLDYYDWDWMDGMWGRGIGN